MPAGISIVIKALNEEAHISAAIQSALAEVQQLGGEVILADSGSTDQTIPIAAGFPVTIVQLADTAEATCGIGPQLGFQEVRGEYVFLMDGDMELIPGFLATAMQELERHSEVAGVSGMMEEIGAANAEFRLRKIMASSDRSPGTVSHLSGGGLYRVSAICSVGYFSNRNLHSFEELELGIRLVHGKWLLKRLGRPSVRHHPHQMGSYRMLLTRWQSKRIWGAGEFLRSAIGKPYLGKVLPRFRFLYVTAAWWLMALATLLLPVWGERAAAFTVVIVAPFVLESCRRKGIGPGSYSVASWALTLLGAVRGCVRFQTDPSVPIRRRLLQQGEWFHGQTLQETPAAMRCSGRNR